MKRHKEAIPPRGATRLSEALDRLVQLYVALDKKDEAAKWRQDLGANKTPAKRPETKP
jgi:hypothetical protein